MKEGKFEVHSFTDTAFLSPFIPPMTAGCPASQDSAREAGFEERNKKTHKGDASRFGETQGVRLFCNSRFFEPALSVIHELKDERSEVLRRLLELSS